MEASDTLRRIRRLEFRTRRAVNEFAPGAYLSLFRGRGIEFAEVREFQTGDDARTIDWRATARLGRPVVKRFDEERELTLMLLVDGSASCRCGETRRQLLDLAAIVAFSALRNHDRIGAMSFTDEPELLLPPGHGRHQAQRVLRELIAHEPQGTGTDVAKALETAHRSARRGTVFVVLSDFLDPGFDAAFRRVSLRHDLVAVRVHSPATHRAPADVWVSLADAETGDAAMLGGDPLGEAERRRGAAIDRRLGSAGAEVLAIAEHDDPLPMLARFLARRHRPRDLRRGRRR
jgi:uncharacterized protein (DUF58 family)